jgi:hypothetical protein
MSVRRKTIVDFESPRSRPGCEIQFCAVRGRRVATLIWAAALALAFPVMAAAQKAAGSKLPTISGVVIQISPRQMTIQGDNGAGVTLTTMKDYTEAVAFGSHVTATYTDEGGVSVLQSLTPPLEAVFIEPDEIRGSIRNVILLPESKVDGADQFYDELEDYLRSAFNWYVKPRAMAEEVRGNFTTSGSAINLIDPKTGRFDMSTYLGTKGDLVRKIAEETRVDAVIDVSIDGATADLDATRRVAKWDGYQESSSEGGRGLDKLTVIPIHTTIPALTVSLGIWNAQGKPLWIRRMGFTVLMIQEGMLGKLREYSLAQALDKQDNVLRWFNLFFQPLLPQGGQPAALSKQ